MRCLTPAGKWFFMTMKTGKDFSFRPEVGTFSKQKVDDEWWRIVWVKSADGNFYIAVGQEREYRTDITMDMVEEFLHLARRFASFAYFNHHYYFTGVFSAEKTCI